MDEIVTGRLEGWYYDDTYRVIWGYLYDDVRNRWWDGANIHTSTISTPKSECVEGALIKTRNSVYLLGKPFSKDTN